jgi:creatinine amidohydrolase
MRAELSHSTWPQIPRGATVLIPVGSTEQHGPHLPLCTDSVIAATVAERTADRLYEPVLVAPVLAFGNSGEHAGFPGTVSIGHEALRLVLIELVRSLALWAERTVLVNGHGGNIRTLNDAVAQLRAEGHQAAWTGCEFPGGDAHAGRTETSVMLHIAPHDVLLERAAAGNTRPLPELMQRLEKNGVRAIAPNGVLGDPSGADAQEGRRLLGALVEATAQRISSFAADPGGRLLTLGTRAGR